MSGVTSDVVRTQVYLDRNDHHRLKQLAARRGVSMTELAREAVARYVADELDDGGPGLDEMVAELRDQPLYRGLPDGPAGLVDRMRARSAGPDDASAPRLDSDDRQFGEALAAEHARLVRTRSRADPPPRP